MEIGRNKRIFIGGTKESKVFFKDKRTIAKYYFSFVATFHGIKVTSMGLNLLAHLAVVGNIVSKSSREDFIKTYNSSSPVISNLLTSLKKTGMLSTIDGKIRINPKIALDFINNDKFLFGAKCLYQKE